MAKPRARRSAESAAAQLATFFWRNGYVRLQNRQRVEKEGPARYRKGDEVRLVAVSIRELQLVRRLLKECEFSPGRPFAKGNQHRLPIYGRDAVARFLEMVHAERDVQ